MTRGELGGLEAVAEAADVEHAIFFFVLLPEGDHFFESLISASIIELLITHEIIKSDPTMPPSLVVRDLSLFQELDYSNINAYVQGVSVFVKVTV